MSEQTVFERSARVKSRRGIGYLLFSVLLPGSVQSHTGAKTLGRWSMRLWFGGLTALVLLLVGLLVLRSQTIALVLNPVFLTLARVFVWTFGLGWALLLLDALRRSQPTQQSMPARLVLRVVALVLACVMIAASAFANKTLEAMGEVGSIFVGSGNTKQQRGRYNILLLGADSGPNREGLRPDSIMVASVDSKTGRTVLFNLPRNLEGAPFPKSNPLHKLYPKGFDCPKSACMLNGIYTLAHTHKNLFKGSSDPGLRSMEDVVGEILGLTINYNVVIDLAGFRTLIDALGGITLDIGRAIPIGGGSSKVSGYIEPGKGVHLDGNHALWFARSRHGSSDYDRMARQKCVINAMVAQLDPITVAGKFSDLAAAGKSVVKTSVPTSEISTLVELALKTKKLPLSSVQFSPPLIHVGRPDFPFIRNHTHEAIERSQALDDPKQAKKPTPKATQSASKNPKKASPEPSPSAGHQETDDLTKVCSVSR